VSWVNLRIHQRPKQILKSGATNAHAEEHQRCAQEKQDHRQTPRP